MKPSKQIPPEVIGLIEAGIDQAAERLAKISHTSWFIQTTSIKPASLDKVTQAAGDGPEDVGVFLGMPDGIFLVIFPTPNAEAVAAAFMAQTEWKKPAPEMKGKILSEVANIIANAVADVLANACNRAAFLGAPSVETGTRSELIDRIPGKINGGSHTMTFMIYVHLSSSAISADCMMVIGLGGDWEPALLRAAQRSKEEGA